MDRKPRVLLVIDEATVGGGQRHVLWLAEGLVRHGYDVAVACEAQGYLVDELRFARIRHFPVHMRNRISIRSLMQTVQTVRAFDPDIVHTHGGTAGVYGRIAARILARKTVHTYHGIHYIRLKEKWKGKAYLFLERFLLEWTSAVICVATSDLRLALKHGLAKKDEAFVIPNGIEAEDFKSIRRGGRKAGRTVIGTIGRLHEQKGHTFLLKAASLVSQKMKAIEFRFVGDGELRTHLEQETHELGLEDSVRFLGSRTDVRAELSQFDVFVLPSLWEGMPFVILEAMSAGVPIVATDVDGTREVLENGRDAILVPPGDPSLLADAILDLVCNTTKAKRLAKNASKKILEQFDATTMVHQTEEVYGFASEQSHS